MCSIQVTPACRRIDGSNSNNIYKVYGIVPHNLTIKETVAKLILGRHCGERCVTGSVPFLHHRCLCDSLADFHQRRLVYHQPPLPLRTRGRLAGAPSLAAVEPQARAAPQHQQTVGGFGATEQTDHLVGRAARR